jgi:hypothetical protein
VSAWNPRYACYAKAHGRTPEAQLEHDDSVCPGGKMAGFLIWMGDRWREFSDLRPDLAPGTRGWDRRAWLSMCHATEFDAWLEQVTA